MPSAPRSSIRVLPWAVVAVTVVVMAAVTIGPFAGTDQVTASPTSSPSSTVSKASAQAVTSTTIPAATTTTTLVPAGLERAVRHAGAALDPKWPKSLTVVTDSVVLGAKDVLPGAMPGWKVDVRGRPALMVKVANKELVAAPVPVGSVAVVALGYNSLWGRDRANYNTWAKKFDSEADAIIATLRSLGAKKVVWVTLRNPDPSVIPASALAQAGKYNWYFPYVNERLDALAERQPSVAIADWAAVSNRVGLTYDAIHLKPLGARLMSEVIKAGAGVTPSAVPGL